MRYKIVLIFIFFFFFSCKKEEGQGGTSVIKGSVFKVYTYQNMQGGFDTLYYQADAGKDVFIIYSDDESEIYDDKFETDYLGRYRFESLRKGDYTLYVHADSSDVNTNYDYPIFKHITITSNNSDNIICNAF